MIVFRTLSVSYTHLDVYKRQAYMLTGSFVIETLFSVPGIGREMVSSIQTRDYSMIMGLTIFLGFLVISFNIITDLLSAVVDPRIKLK